MIGLTALLGGLAVISRVHTIFKLLPAQTVAIMAFWCDTFFTATTRLF